jgi:hypothetical protein
LQTPIFADAGLALPAAFSETSFPRYRLFPTTGPHHFPDMSLNSPGAPRTVHGILLSREPSGERFLKLALLDARRGLAWCLLRTSHKSGATTPDLFDVAEALQDERGQPEADGPVFISEYRVLRRFPGIGAGYARLAAASRFARLLVRNPPPPDSAPEAFALCERAFAAFDSRPRPDATLFKSLWWLARDGGWPALEHWLAGLASRERESAESVLRQPLDAQTLSEADVSRLVERFEEWLVRECHFLPGQ